MCNAWIWAQLALYMHFVLFLCLTSCMQLLRIYVYMCVVCVTIATPADVSLLMQLGVDGVFVGSGIFKSGDPEKRAQAMVQAVTHYADPAILARVSEDLGQPMVSYPVWCWSSVCEDLGQPMVSFPVWRWSSVREDLGQPMVSFPVWRWSSVREDLHRSTYG